MKRINSFDQYLEAKKSLFAPEILAARAANPQSMEQNPNVRDMIRYAAVGAAREIEKYCGIIKLPIAISSEVSRRVNDSVQQSLTERMGQWLQNQLDRRGQL